jgi:hypothetical protein
MDNPVIKTLHEKYYRKINNLLLEYEYRYFRYRLEYTLVFFYLSEEENISGYTNLVRLTDTFLALEKHFYCIVYEGANAEQATKAANNLLSHYKKEYKEGEIFITILSPGKKKMHREDIVTLLFKSLETITTKNKSNIVVTLDN